MWIRGLNRNFRRNVGGAKLSPVAKMISTLRRLGGTLIYAPDNLAGTYVDNVGTTPVTAVADLIGLITDKSYGGQLGVELVTTPNISLSASDHGIGPALVAGKRYQVGFTVSNYTGTGDCGFDDPTFTATAGVTRLSGNGAARGIVVAAGGPVIGIFTRVSNSATFSNISVREVPGNHATQSAVASKPSFQRVPKRLASERVPNGDFSGGTAGWDATTTGTLAVSGGFLEITCTGAGYGAASRVIPLVIGKTYWFQASSPDSGVTVRLNNTTSGAPLASLALAANSQAIPYTATEASVSVSMHTNSNVAGTKRRFDPISVREVLEWANVIQLDGNNDFLQTGITTGNEGWVCAGVTQNAAATCYPFAAGGVSDTVAGANLRLINGITPQIQLGDGVARQVVQSTVTPALGTPFIYSGGWNASTVFVGVDGAEVSAARTRNPTATTPATIGQAAGGGFLQGNMHAFAYTPVLPSAADRKIIRDGIAALQGRTL